MNGSIRPPDTLWYLCDLPGLCCPAVVFRSGRSWRVRLAAVRRSGALAFDGEGSFEPPEVGVVFGDFLSDGAALEFVSGVANGLGGVGVDVAAGTRQGFEGEVPDPVASEHFFKLEDGADPVSGANAAVVLMFDCMDPGFSGDVGDALEAARSVPVRVDPAPAEFYERSVPRARLPDSVVAAGGIDAVMALEADEEMRFAGAAGVDGDDDGFEGGWPRDARDVRPMGILARDGAEDVAKVASRMATGRSSTLKVDEFRDTVVEDDGVVRRSFSVFTVIKVGDLENGRLRSALGDMFKDRRRRAGT